MTELESVPPGSAIEIRKLGLLRYRLRAWQVLSCRRERAFEFFKNPANLCDITPAWLSFSMLDRGTEPPVREGAEYDYTIRWLGLSMGWRSRIIDYHPPERFTDIQLRGPYRSWVHVHTFIHVHEGTLMKDEVTYRIPLPALPVNGIIRRQLRGIFTYRKRRIDAWVRSIAPEGRSGDAGDTEANHGAGH